MAWARMVVFLLAMAVPALGYADPLVDRAKAREQASGNLMCAELQYMPDAFYVGDISKDGMDDVIVNTGAISCDRVIGAECNAFGCPYRLYVQTEDGKVAYAGQVRAFSYELRYLFGIRRVAFRIAGKRCEPTGSRRCDLVIRVSGTQIVTLSTEKPKP